MRDQIVSDLSTAIDPNIASDLVTAYEDVVNRYRKGDIDGCLAASGRFIEHSLRAIEFIRTGNILLEVKNPQKIRQEIENDTSLPEPLRLLIPRVGSAMVYDIRSKTGAVHVKLISPRQIDASLAVHASSWIVAELLRQFHSSVETDVTAAMQALMRTYAPYIEQFGDEEIVTQKVSCELEILLLLSNAGNVGLDRTELGKASQYSPSSVSRYMKKLAAHRFVFKARDGRYHITGPGEARAADLVHEFVGKA